jgi:hypothetical protein
MAQFAPLAPVAQTSPKVGMKNPASSASPPEPSDKVPEVSLDSWKEIASYVKRDVTTVQRWEKREGMPVHRHVHDKRGSVYAYSSELDAWLQSRKLRLEEEEKEHGEETSENAESDHESRGNSLAEALVRTSGIAALPSAVAYVMTRNRASGVTRSKIESLRYCR